MHKRFFTQTFFILSLLFSWLLSAARAPSPTESTLPLKAAAIDFSVPGGVSYVPQQEIEVTVSLENTSRKNLNLQGAQFRFRRTREVVNMDKPKDIWGAAWEDYETLAQGALQLPKTISPGETVSFSASVTPGKYGFFSLFLNLPEVDKEEWARVTGVAVVYKPAEGFVADSPYLAGLPYRLKEITEGKVSILGRFGFKRVRWGNPMPDRNSDGSYDFTRLDQVIKYLRRNSVYLHGTLMPYALDRPQIGGKDVTYRKNKSHWVVPREKLEGIDTVGTFANHVYQMISRYGDIFTQGFVRNEPWEGGSISNYHGTAEYMREATAIAYSAAKKANPDFMIGGADSAENLIDQILTAPGTSELYEFTTHHLYGAYFKDNRGPAISKALGIPAFENETWASPGDSFVVGHISLELGQGYEMVHPVSKGFYLPALNTRSREIVGGPRPIGQIASIWLHFIEQTKHVEEMIPEALPWVELFKGKEGYKDKNCAVVIGRFKLYGGGYKKDEGDCYLRRMKKDGLMVLSDPSNSVTVYSIEGNPVDHFRSGEALRIPLTEDPYYLVSSKGYEHLRDVLKGMQVDYSGCPFEATMKDLAALPETKPTVEVTVENGINRELDAVVKLTPPAGWKLESETATLKNMKPGDLRTIVFQVVEGVRNRMNSYPFKLEVTRADGNGEALVLEEDLHATVIRKGTPTIDGNLSDWEDAVPVYLYGGKMEEDIAKKLFFMTAEGEKEKLDQTDVACRFAAQWDDEYFYISAEVNDPSENYSVSMEKGIHTLTHDAPLDYLYWHFSLPGFRQKNDSLKIAFDVIPHGQKPDAWIPPSAQQYLDTRFVEIGPDYEIDFFPAKANQLVHSYQDVLARHKAYIKNPPNKKYRRGRIPFEKPELEFVGEGFPEVWRRRAPGVPSHCNYPFSPKWPKDQGVVKDAQFVFKRTDNGWIYEAAIPWSELRMVHPAPGKTVNFAFFVNNDGRTVLDWNKGRSAPRGRTVRVKPFYTAKAIKCPWTFSE